MKTRETRRRPWRGILIGVATIAVSALLPGVAQAETADLSVSTTDSPDPVVEGGTLTYSIVAANHGPEDAHGVVLRDELSGQVAFVSASASQGSCDTTGKTVRCSLGQLPVGDATVTIKVTAKKAGQITNRSAVSLAASDTDPVASNDLDIDTTTVSAPPPDVPVATCGGSKATIVGTGAAETLLGTPRRDVIKARGGNDVIRGLAVGDVVCAGGGDDTVRGGGGNDRLRGGAGRDLIKGGGGGDALDGGTGRDTCRGGGGSDTKRSC